jgi:hypothetical protein
MQVHPSVEVMRKNKLDLDKPITLPVLRNMGKLEAGDELFVLEKKKKKTAEVEEVIEADNPRKRLRGKTS